MENSNKEILVKFERKIIVEEEIPPSKCRIGETFFTSMDVIGGKLFSKNRKNMKHVHKGSNYLLYVILNLGKKIRGGGHRVY